MIFFFQSLFRGFLILPIRVFLQYFTIFRYHVISFIAVLYSNFVLVYFFAVYFLHFPTILFKPLFLGVTADILGFPNSAIIHDWFNAKQFDLPIIVPPAQPKQLKNPEIPILKECNIPFLFLLRRRHLSFYNFSGIVHISDIYLLFILSTISFLTYTVNILFILLYRIYFLSCSFFLLFFIN